MVAHCGNYVNDLLNSLKLNRIIVKLSELLYCLIDSVILPLVFQQSNWHVEFRSENQSVALHWRDCCWLQFHLTIFSFLKSTSNQHWIKMTAERQSVVDKTDIWLSQFTLIFHQKLIRHSPSRRRSKKEVDVGIELYWKLG